MRFNIFFVVLVFFSILSCNQSDKTEDPDLCIVKSDYVGIWKGTLTGTNGTPTLPSFGTADIKVQFKDDGIMGPAPDNPVSQYCPVDGEWCISESKAKFFAEGKDCGGTTVRFGAPSTLMHLAGTWTASSGREGTFDIVKQ